MAYYSHRFFYLKLSLVMATPTPHHSSSEPSNYSAVEQKNPRFFMPIFVGIIVGVLVYVGISLSQDLSHLPALGMTAIVLLGLALLIALGFEFVNGFHDTANAVATVIYTNALPAPVAVIWAGFCNFLGVMLSSGAVAYGIIALLPVELIMNVNSGAGFAMIFAMLLSAILWNLGTWYLGIPASSSHTLIGSILGVGVMNYILHYHTGDASGVDMAQVTKVAYALFFSPLIGFILALILFLCVKTIFKKQSTLFQPPVGKTPPPLPIRAMQILTCTGVSFVHGSNDGQKGMGLIMLILIAVAPMAYSLNQQLNQKDIQQFQQLARQTSQVFIVQSNDIPSTLTNPQAEHILTQYIQNKQHNELIHPALSHVSRKLSHDLAQYQNIRDIPEQKVDELRNELYLSMSALKLLDKQKHLANFSPEQQQTIKSYRQSIDGFLQYIPDWVKIAVAFALGMGTMVGWKRIVVTVGEKIGKNRLSYGQGISAELVSISTIAGASAFGMPVSTTQVLNSAVAGTMVGNKSGLNFSTIKSILSAWVLTLPTTIILSGCLYWLLLKIFV